MKGGVITLYERILREYERLGEACEAIRRELSSLPEGKLICCHESTKCKWYRSDGHKKIYIPKKERILVCGLHGKISYLKSGRTGKGTTVYFPAYTYHKRNIKVKNGH